MSTRHALALLAALALVAGCGGNEHSDDDQLVWCVAPGEKVTPAFKQEYPDLRMSRAACDAVKGDE